MKNNPKKEREKMKHFIALLLKILGFKPNFSTGIHGGETCGYGKLNHNGYWEYEIY